MDGDYEEFVPLRPGADAFITHVEPEVVREPYSSSLEELSVVVGAGQRYHVDHALYVVIRNIAVMSGMDPDAAWRTQARAQAPRTEDYTGSTLIVTDQHGKELPFQERRHQDADPVRIDISNLWMTVHPHIYACLTQGHEIMIRQCRGRDVTLEALMDPRRRPLFSKLVALLIRECRVEAGHQLVIVDAEPRLNRNCWELIQMLRKTFVAAGGGGRRYTPYTGKLHPI